MAREMRRRRRRRRRRMLMASLDDYCSKKITKISDRSGNSTAFHHSRAMFATDSIRFSVNPDGRESPCGSKDLQTGAWMAL
jgi:hypothetical protein